MKFSEKLNKFFSEGIEISKDVLKKAGQKTRELGEKGIIKVDIYQLKNQAGKICADLGAECFARLREKGEECLNRDDEHIKELLDRIEELQNKIEQKEEQYRKVGGTDEDVNL